VRLSASSAARSRSRRSPVSSAGALRRAPLGFQGEPLAGRLELGEQAPEVAVLVAQERLGACDPLCRQVHPPGQSERLAAAGRTGQEAKSRPPGRGLELHRRAGRPGELERRRREAGQVGRDERQPAALDQRLEQRHRERRALLRVGAGTELVEQRQAVGTRRPIGLGQARQAPGEGGAVGQQILLVAHRRDQAGEKRHFARGGGRNRQAGLRGERQEAQRLQVPPSCRRRWGR
jgi:hypothetical protein